ncbi:thioredoxin family protein [Gorillibacterium massiliense]|uniref:thioredoxin family protein n=1 Tax=Gorillibacterium massiliense TaxID=1280390 RepID=UPI0004B208B9|nr:thioredoxin family protein [Gorillibacterium massiliense]
MAQNLAGTFGKGITPAQFMDGMQKNKETFVGYYDGFTWPSEEDKEFYASLKNRDDLRAFILMAEWCGDVVRNVPVVFRALESAGIPVEVLIIEEHPEIMDQFLTLGGRSIPIVIITDTGGFVLGKWGPRPEHVQAVMRKFKEENPDREAPDYQDKIAVARQDMMNQYGEGTGYQAVILKELRSLLSKF